MAALPSVPYYLYIFGVLAGICIVNIAMFL